MTAQATKPMIQGMCASGGRQIPFGYIPVVTAWAVKVWAETSNSKLTVMVPATLYCRPCGDDIQGPAQRRMRRSFVQEEQEPVSEELSAKEIMRRIYGVMSDTPHGSKKLAEMAGLEYSELILDILKVLRKAGKIEVTEGRWVKA